MNPSALLRNIFAFALVVTGLVLIVFAYRGSELQQWWSLRQDRARFAQEVEKIDAPLRPVSLSWFEDVQRDRRNPTSRVDWGSVGSVEISAKGDFAQRWKDQLVLPFKTRDSGRLHADVLLVSWKDDKTAGVIVQQTFMDRKSKNFLTEVSQTYFLEGEAGKYDGEPTPGLVQFIKDRASAKPAPAAQ
jgi:hypothetical protein